MGYKLIETLRPLVAPSLRSSCYSLRALLSLFNLYPYVSLSNYYLVWESGNRYISRYNNYYVYSAFLFTFFKFWVETLNTNCIGCTI